MTANQVAERIEGLIIDGNKEFTAAISGVQNRLYSDLVTILKFLDVDENGYIKQNAGNRQILRAAQKRFDETIQKSGYQDIVGDQLRSVPRIDALNSAYFESVSSAFKPNRQFIASLQKQAIETANSYLLQDGLAAQVRTPLNEILSQNINTGGQFSGMLDQVRTFIKGGLTADGKPLDGRLMSYSRGILKDVLFQYSRAFQNSVTEDLGLIWYLFAGGLMDTSRPWCIRRVGRYFHQKEIESWASEDWAGKNNLTTESSIFILVGGHNCEHQLIPVSDIIVPADDITRAKEAGLIR